MKALLFMLPRIWKVEERVAGADLGLGRFQFDFDKEENIAEVMKMQPFHFDYWMLSLVRWSPVVDPNYPSAIKFWVRVIGVPLHFWADETFRCIGKAIGDVKAVNLDDGKIQVVIDGQKPLCFETVVEFQGGEETIVYLRYERLFGYCRNCFSLCHDHQRCPNRSDVADRKFAEDNGEDQGKIHGPASYRAAMLHVNAANKERGRNGGSVGSQKGPQKGKGKESSRQNAADEDGRQQRSRSEWKYGEGSSRYTRPSSYVPPKEMTQKQTTSGAMRNTPRQLEKIQANSDQAKVDQTKKDRKEDERQMTQSVKGITSTVLPLESSARKSLTFEDGGFVSFGSRDTDLMDSENMNWLAEISDSFGSFEEAIMGEEASGDDHGMGMMLEGQENHMLKAATPKETQGVLTEENERCGKEDGEIVEVSEMVNQKDEGKMETLKESENGGGTARETMIETKEMDSEALVGNREQRRNSPRLPRRF
ncbi:cilia- and flagella-associated protein 251-like [Eutrema salsugineum]|uniref:cilia- and flagella-associated protein 251-like n=1 Tax=Eutrema salsugineum TaxID=72664 RepID=UPI000CED14BE|nr:cilia- and flagella-associated protein 251-like [Eutrema salsugineum]